MKLFAGPNAHRVIEGCIEQISRCDLYFATNRKTQVFCNIFNMFLIVLEVLLAAFCIGAGDVKTVLLLLPIGMMIACNAVANIVFNSMVEQYTRVLKEANQGK